MWELICHQDYKPSEAAVDLSGHGSHGQLDHLLTTDFRPDGAGLGSGALTFPRPGCRIRVARTPIWEDLGGIAAEVLVRRTSSATANQVLLAGEGSFSLKITGQFLFADFEDDPLGINTFDDAVDQQPHPVPVGPWVALRLIRADTGTVQLLFDEVLMAQRSGFGAQLTGLGGLGVSIGNDPVRDDSFCQHIEIDEVKVWRPAA